MAGTLKTEAIVLRSLRYSEADRIIHVYTPSLGRLGAIAKGVRKSNSRFGGRLEPFFRLHLVLYEGRGELFTVTGAETISGYPRLREHAATLDSAARACDAVSRLFEAGDANPAVYNLLTSQLALLDSTPEMATHANQLAFRLKLLLASGHAPHLAACATCGEHEGLTGYSGAAGGVVCSSCEASSFSFDQEAHAFLTQALALPLAQTPQATQRALSQAERAISETLEHHAQVRWRPAVTR